MQSCCEMKNITKEVCHFFEVMYITLSYKLKKESYEFNLLSVSLDTPKYAAIIFFGTR